MNLLLVPVLATIINSMLNLLHGRIEMRLAIYEWESEPRKGAGTVYSLANADKLKTLIYFIRVAG